MPIDPLMEFALATLLVLIGLAFVFRMAARERSTRLSRAPVSRGR